MKTHLKTVEELINNNEKCPLPLEVIPNNMGINLVSVDAISWQKQEDGQLTQLTIYFIPNNESRPVQAGVSNANGDKLVIAKEMCEKIIKHWETDKLYTKDPFSECYLLAKETLSRLSC